MTTPGWYPTPNPGGSNRETTRKALAAWVDAQHISGVMHVYNFRPTRYRFDDWPGGDSRFPVLIGTVLGATPETRTAYTGPTDVGGKTVMYAATLEIVHRTINPDDAQSTSAAMDDYDRIIDATIDCLRGVGRDLGRPEVVLTAGEWPRTGGIRYQPGPLSEEQSGAVTRMGMVNFNIAQYLVEYP